MEFRSSGVLYIRWPGASFRSNSVLTCAVLLLALIGFAQPLPSGDQAALRAIAQHWPILTSEANGWSVTNASAACDTNWKGLVCGSTPEETQTVIEINLSGEQLTNQIAPAIFDLSTLLVLNLSSNALDGTLGDGWASLPNLKTLDLSGNGMHGSLPGTLGSLLRMENLRLDANKFTGYIPSSLQQLSALTHLNVSLNPITGYLLDWIGVFPQLRSLSAAYTHLIPATWINDTGPKLVYAISPSIVNCTHLNLLDLRSTCVGLPLPAELGALSELETLIIAGANNFPNVTHSVSLKHLDFTFDEPRELPNDLGGMQVLEYLRIGGHMSGKALPSSIGDLPLLRHLVLEFTNFQTDLPTSFEQLKNLTTLEIQGAGLGGLLPLGSWPLLELVDASQNNFSRLPSTLDEVPDRLGFLYLEENAFTGALPAWLGNLTSLQIVNVQGNLFSSLPSSIGNLGSTLEILLLSGNLITDLPSEMSQLTGLQSLGIAGLNLAASPFNDTHHHSSIFDIVKSMTSLRTLIMVGTGLNGTIPETIGELTLLEDLYLSDNRLSGSLPDSINEGLPNLNALYLDNNQINGTIPSWLGNKTSLSHLLLSHNSLSGNIPPEMALLKVQVLSLSHNRLSGTIPHELGLAPFLIGLDLSHNELSGSLPVSFNHSGPSHYFSLLDLSYNRLSFCPSNITEFPMYLQVSGICNLRHQKEPWTRPYDCGCQFDAFDNCQVDYPLENCVPCVGNPPSGNANWECQHGQWVLTGATPSLSNTTLTIGPSPVIIPGNLTTSPITFEGLDGSLKVGGCASITNVTIILTLTDIERLLKMTESERSKVLISSGGCNLGSVPFSIVNPEGSCAKAYAFTASTSGSLIAAFNINKSACEKSKWWIILVAVIASVIILTASAALVWYLIRQRKDNAAHSRITNRSTR